MANNFHISNDGVTRKCTAKFKACQLTHFDSVEEAEAYSAKILESAHPNKSLNKKQRENLQVKISASLREVVNGKTSVFEEELQVNIPVVSVDESPKFLTVWDERIGSDSDYVMFEGGFYKSTNHSEEDLFNPAFERSFSFLTKEEGLAEAERIGKSYIVRDGKVFYAAPEPVYYVKTFGTNGRSGETGVFVELNAHNISKDTPVTPNIFPLSKHSEALDFALKVASSRGNITSYETIRNTPALEYDADVFTPGRTFIEAPRLQYSSVEDLGGPYAPKGTLEEGLRIFRKEIATIPDAVIEVDDGWGGKKKSVDFTKLTPNQKKDYKELVNALARWEN